MGTALCQMTWGDTCAQSHGDYGGPIEAQKRIEPGSDIFYDASYNLSISVSNLRSGTIQTSPGEIQNTVVVDDAVYHFYQASIARKIN